MNLVFYFLFYIILGSVKFFGIGLENRHVESLKKEGQGQVQWFLNE